MSEATYDVTFRVRTRAARAWIYLMRAARFVVGAERAYRWAVKGALRLCRVEVIGGKFSS